MMMRTENRPEVDRLGVLVHGPGQWGFIRMFAQRSDEYRGVSNLDDADIVVFTGGEDINPKLYGEKPLPETRWNDIRDKVDIDTYNFARRKKKFLVGVCRGGQFLNVMNGGRLWQHVGQHTMDHELVDLKTNNRVKVSSTHHQMMQMDPRKGQRVAACNQAKYKYSLGCSWKADDELRYMKDGILHDDEVLWYKDTRSLCFQPHPEYEGYPECTEYFFSLLDRYFDFGDQQ